MNKQRPWVRILLALAIVAAIAMGSAALGYRLASVQPVVIDAEGLAQGGPPAGERFDQGFDGRRNVFPAGPAGIFGAGFLPWLLLSGVLIVGLGVLLAKVLWPGKVVEAAAPIPAETPKKKPTAKTAK